MDDEDSLVRRRSRRSTAGNRMEAALAEISVEDPQEGDEDRDFVTDPDEGDIFESDFESTDDEAAQPAAEAPDSAVAEDERRERKAIKSRLERATAAAAARQRVTFNPEAEESISTPKSEREKKRRRVSLGAAVDAETGELVGDRRRQSGRALTALARTASLARRVEEEKQKSSAPKKTKVKEKPPTQDELLQRALDMEDGNIAAHRDYLAIEEEKRRRAHVVRVAVECPLVRWISRREVRELSPSSDITTAAVIPSPSPAAPVASVSTSADTLDQSIANRLATMSTPTASSPDLPAVVPFQPGQQTSLYTTLFPPKSIPKPLPSTKSPLPPPSSPPRPREPAPPTTEMVAQQYLVHESSQDLDARTPPWKDTMAALFGDHVAWSELRVYAAKNRPLARPVRACPITGLPARYRDPRTGVPFATPEAYAVLTKILNHEYVWSPVLGCYVTPYEVSGESGTSATGSKDKITRESSRRGRRGEVHSETAP